MKLVHVTDTHLVAPGQRLYDGDPAARLEAAFADINARHADARFVLLSGDLVHRGDPRAYRVLRRLLEGLAVPWHLAIGNHDRRDAFAECFPETPRDGAGFVQYALETEQGVFLVLDTVDEGRHSGDLCPTRLAWLGAQIERHAGRALFLVMHHPPLALGMPGVDRFGLRASEALWRCLEPAARRVRHLFFGHVHRPVGGSWRGIPVSSLRGTNHQLALDFDGAREDDAVTVCLEPPAYGVVLVDDQSVIVHQHDFLDRSPHFSYIEPPRGDAAAIEAGPLADIA